MYRYAARFGNVNAPTFSSILYFNVILRFFIAYFMSARTIVMIIDHMLSGGGSPLLCNANALPLFL